MSAICVMRGIRLIKWFQFFNISRFLIQDFNLNFINLLFESLYFFTIVLAPASIKLFGDQLLGLIVDIKCFLRICFQVWSRSRLTPIQYWLIIRNL